MKIKPQTEIGRCNYYALICHTIVDVVLVACYSLETFIKHERSVGYFLAICFLGIVPIVIEWVFFLKNEETRIIKHGLGYGFGIFYTFLLFTASSPLTFTYIILVIPVLSVFNDKAHSLRINICAIILNLIHVAIGLTTGKLGFINLAASEIQVALIILMAIFSITQAALLKKNNDFKLNTVVL